MKINLRTTKASFICTIIIILILIISIISWIFMNKSTYILNGISDNNDILYGYIYQDGIQIEQINLSNITESYQKTISDDNGNYNIIEIRHNSIGIIEANCPDKLCIHMGFIHNSLLPITCLPNHLVVQIKTVANEKNNANDIDGFVY